MATQEELEKLQAAMDDHQVTDDDGNLNEETDTPATDTAEVEEEPTEEVTVEGENPAEEDDNLTRDDESLDEEEHTDTETGQSVPLSRFNSVYGQKKALEREVAELRRKSQGSIQTPNQPPSKVDLLEEDMIRDKYPQFVPDSDKYSPVLDSMAADIYEASHGSISKLQAAQQALDRAKKLGAAREAVQREAKAVKVAQADRGVSKRNQKVDKTVKVEEMTLAEKEAYLKAKGLW